VTMPDVTRTVSRTTTLLARLGLPPDRSLREVIKAARAASAKVSPASGLATGWLDQLAMEAETRLRALQGKSPRTRKDAEHNARTAKQAGRAC
jgi:hypothetical protein